MDTCVNRPSIFLLRNANICLYPCVQGNIIGVVDEHMFVFRPEGFSMRWFAFGRAVGVGWDGDDTLWMTISNERVMDASVSARACGVEPGQSVHTAAALVPGITVQPATEGPSRAMRRLWRMVNDVTPRLETMGEDGFCAAGSGRTSETALHALRAAARRWLEERPGVRGLLVGVAETPGLARALVEWRKCGELPASWEQSLGRHGRWLVSPRLKPSSAARNRCTGAHEAAESWWDPLPVEALWVLPAEVREMLLRMGVLTFGELEKVGETFWRRMLPGLSWTQLRHQVCVGRLRVNYPPPVYCRTWAAAAGEVCPPEQLTQWLEPLIQGVGRELLAAGCGTRRLGLCWRGEGGRERMEMVLKQPTADLQVLRAQTLRLAAHIRQPVERVSLFVRDFTSLPAEQLRLLAEDGRVISADPAAHALAEVLAQVERRFPGRLQKGLRPGFRELRLARVMEARLAVGSGNERHERMAMP